MTATDTTAPRIDALLVTFRVTTDAAAPSIVAITNRKVVRNEDGTFTQSVTIREGYTTIESVPRILGCAWGVPAEAIDVVAIQNAGRIQ